MENIECEIMNVLSDEVKESFSENRILELNNEKLSEMSENIEKIIEKYKSLSV